MTDADDQKLHEKIRQMVGSEYWKLIRTYLLNRRAQLFLEDPTDDAARWKREGAMREIHHLIMAPEQALYAMAQQQMQHPDEDFHSFVNGSD